MTKQLKRAQDDALRAKRGAAEMYEQMTTSKSAHVENKEVFESQVESLTKERNALNKTVRSLRSRLQVAKEQNAVVKKQFASREAFRLREKMDAQLSQQQDTEEADNPDMEVSFASFVAKSYFSGA